MPTISGTYDSAPIQPIARIKENLSIWTMGQWGHYRIDFMEPLPAGPQSTVEMITFSGAVTLAAGGQIAKRIVTILQPNELEFLHLRWEPLDNVQGVLWEQAGQAKFVTRGFQARVDKNTKNWDPYLTTTTFWILGQNRDMNLEVWNPLPVAISMARFRFWGYRYILSQYNAQTLISEQSNIDEGSGKYAKLVAEVTTKLAQGDPDTVKKYIGATTWVTAEGRMS